MENEQVKSIIAALPNPPQVVAPSASALLSKTYWDSISTDLTAISAALSGLEEHDAVIACRRLANSYIHGQKEVILSRCRKIVAMRSQWMEELERERESFRLQRRHNGRHGDSFSSEKSYDGNGNGSSSSGSTSFSNAKYFCDRTLEKIGLDHDLSLWSSQRVHVGGDDLSKGKGGEASEVPPPPPSSSSSSTNSRRSACSGGKDIILQLKLTPSIADVLELPETFAVPASASSSASAPKAPAPPSAAPCSSAKYQTAMLASSKTVAAHTSTSSSSSPIPSAYASHNTKTETVIFRAPPLKRSGTWVHPNPSSTIGFFFGAGDSSDAAGGTTTATTTSGSSSVGGSLPDEDQMLYYLRIYLSFGGDDRMERGEFLSQHLVQQAALLLATQIALFELTQTSEAKFDIADPIPPLLSFTERNNSDQLPLHLHHAFVVPFVAAAGPLTPYLLPCSVTIPSEAVPSFSAAAATADKLSSLTSSQQQKGGGAAARCCPPPTSQKLALGSSVLAVGGVLPHYVAMPLQLHDATSFGWALKYCYGEIIKNFITTVGGGGNGGGRGAIVDGDLASAVTIRSSSATGSGNTYVDAQREDSFLASVFVPPAVVQYVKEFVVSQSASFSTSNEDE